MIFQPLLRIIAETDQGSIAPRHRLPTPDRGISLRVLAIPHSEYHQQPSFAARPDWRVSNQTR